MTKTQKAKELIIKELKEYGVLQHKEIVKRLSNIEDEDTGKPFFTIGHINGAFVSLNKKLNDLNIIKYKKDGGVYYQYITEDIDLNNVEKLSANTLNDLINKLRECFKSAHLLKNEILQGEFEKNDKILDLISKINELELFVLKNDF